LCDKPIPEEGVERKGGFNLYTIWHSSYRPPLSPPNAIVNLDQHSTYWQAISLFERIAVYYRSFQGQIHEY
jgi:hypothetical protein